MENMADTSNGEAEDSARPPQKRRRLLASPTRMATAAATSAASASFTRRKRAAQACQFCRLRKTKCDNVRPCCGTCLHHRARCIYDDDEEPGSAAYYLKASTENNTHHNGDDASQRDILARLDEIRDMLRQSQNHSQSTNMNSQTPWAGPSNLGGSSHTPGPGGAVTDNNRRVEIANVRRSPLRALRPESLLQWPVFQSILSDADAGIESFLLESDHGEASERSTGESAVTGRGVRDDAYVLLCRKFLAHVHPRNPLLDADTLMRYARDIQENGLRWDSASCLVVSLDLVVILHWSSKKDLFHVNHARMLRTDSF